MAGSFNQYCSLSVFYGCLIFLFCVLEPNQLCETVKHHRICAATRVTCIQAEFDARPLVNNNLDGLADGGLAGGRTSLRTNVKGKVLVIYGTDSQKEHEGPFQFYFSFHLYQF